MTAIFSRADHDRVLGGYAKPTWLVASKPDAESDLVFEGPAADLRHNYWIARTEDPEKVRVTDFPLDFGQPVAERLLLTDASRASDLLSGKVVAIETLRGQYLSANGARAVQSWLSHFLWFVRWRLALGVPQFQRLSLSLFDHFCDRLQDGRLALVPIENRIVHLEKRLREGEWTWPVSKWKKRQIDVVALATELGVSRQALYGEIRQRLMDLIESTAPELVFGMGREADLDPESADAYSTDDEGLASGSVSRVLSSWRRFHYCSSVGLLPHDPLTFDPFKEISLTARVKQIARKPKPDAGEGKNGGRTGTPGPEHWLRLLDGAARWVMDYSEPITKICRLAREKQIEIYPTPWFTPRREERFTADVLAIIDTNLTAEHPGAPRIAPRWKRHGRPGRRGDFEGMTLDDALGHVVTACLVLIGGFSARRGGELDSLQAGCAYKDPSGSGNWLMTSYIEKTIRDNAEIPIPAMVAVAVQLLEELSETARERDGTNWLTAIYRPSVTSSDKDVDKRSYLRAKLAATLNEFAELVGARKDDDGNIWHFSAHQLRRGFSIYYYHGNRFSNLDALSRFLRHYDPEMTLRYITEVLHGALMRLREVIEARSRQAIAEGETATSDPILTEARAAATSLAELAQEHEEVRQEHFVIRTLEVYDGDETPIGQGAATLYDELEDMVAKARRSIRIKGRSNISPNEEREALITQLRKHAPALYIEPHSGKHAHCRCKPHTPTDLTHAVCLQNKARETGITDSVRPDFAFASAEDCYGCRHGIAFSENVAVMNRKVDEAEAAAVKSPNETFRVAAKARLEAYQAKLGGARQAVRGHQRL
ncbi:conserved protein of unknown function (plasmid) [Rhodovastum atsumiense]|uniref:Uncharacterized protein n=1 Tax=Rhodovastum atsumiense TaxID=504468 RepID=A0A5M6IL09_9PROT|nr:hypothetical protein [Rhodovastum atsumiense]KAA5608607.1 hypothetical protein F1189_28215 [Rhodovastum atsumiense]CAH2605884.1 conserved protein of unknown function [Rhodovastum atsumiense]